MNNVVTPSPSSSAGILSSAPTFANPSISQDQYNQLIALLQPPTVAAHGLNASVSVLPSTNNSCVNQLSTLTLTPNADSQRSKDMENDWFS
ncbi:hypothetical protein QN277_024367 [Acacia crassicarpa]|uniref:Uncharacterized protein n=1 Tax=Acacia crassicarpa TaxID=499986 RepID=A0AAE1JFR1_9FABA|nr:hypothetical protein QN277_024367 [Acacia crassicarpa]